MLGPFLKAGHPTQSKKPSASFTDEEIAALANFLRQRINDTMRGSPIFTVGDIVTGDAKAGEAFFNGDGGCTKCHNASRAHSCRDRHAHSRAGRSAAADAVPRHGTRGRGGRPRGGPPAAGAPAAPPAADRNAITVSIASGSGAPLSGVLVEESDFYVTLREADGTVRTVRRVPGMKVTRANPLQAHIDLLDRVTDGQIHDLVAYLETLK